MQVSILNLRMRTVHGAVNCSAPAGCGHQDVYPAGELGRLLVCGLWCTQALHQRVGLWLERAFAGDNCHGQADGLTQRRENGADLGNGRVTVSARHAPSLWQRG